MTVFGRPAGTGARKQVENAPQRHGEARHEAKSVSAGVRGGWVARKALSGAFSKIARRSVKGGDP